MTLTAYYDLKTSPPTFNAMDFLLVAEMERIKLGLERIRVRVLSGPKDGFRDDSLPPFGAEARRRWLENIVLPMPLLLPSCDGPAVYDDGDEPEGHSIGRGEYLVGFGVQVRAARANVFPFRGTFERAQAYEARHGKGYVTVTFRETGWWKSRQSDLQAWAIAASVIKSKGYRVVIVRDGVRAHEPFEGFPTEPAASLNVVERASLYAGAAMNLGIANGPLWFCLFMGAPVAIFNLVHDDEPSASASMFEGAGLKVGTQLPNMGKNQRLVWGKDTPEAIVGTFNELMG